MVIDASAVRRGFFPDEEGHAVAQAIIRAYVQERMDLHAPILLSYEVTSAILRAVRRGRLNLTRGKEILAAFQDLGIRTVEVSGQRGLELARRYERSAYDGACLALAEETGDQLVTGDRRLYNALKDHLPWALWIEDYTPQ
jgi:predicted nucleic acid-binding protein